MNKIVTRTWIGLSILAALIAGPYLAQGDYASREQSAAHLQKIGEMSVAERDHLDRNFTFYQGMSAEEKQTTIALHQDLARDQKERGGELSRVMDQYTDWLNSIEPYQRDRLKEITDPNERIAIMREIVSQQAMRKAERFSGSPRNIPGPFSRFNSSPPPPIDLNSLTRLLDGLMEMNPTVFAGKTKRINETSGLRRLFEILAAFHPNRDDDDPRMGGRPFEIYDELRIPLEKLVMDFDKYVEDSDAREYVNEPDDDRWKAVRLARLVKENFVRLVISEIFNNKTPTITELEAYFDSLPERDQDRLLELAAVDFYQRVVLETNEERLGPEKLRHHQLHNFFYRGFGLSRRGRGGGPGPPGRGGDDRGRRGDDDERRGRGGFGGRPGENRPGDGRFGDGRRPFGPRPDFENRERERPGPPQRPVEDND